MTALNTTFGNPTEPARRARAARRRLCAWAMCLATAVLAGCAGMATGRDSSVYEADPSLDLSNFGESTAAALVVIRYPAIVDSDAAAFYYRSFAENAIGGELTVAEQVKPGPERIAQAVIAKSNYLVMSLYRELRDRLPEGSVLLSPHIIEGRDGSRQITSRPLLATEQLPSVLTIDFNVYSYPNPARMMDAEPLTFGDLVTPLVVVHANRWLRPATHGLLLSSEPLVGAAWSLAEAQASAEFDAVLARDADVAPRPLDFVSYLDGRGVAAAQRDLPLKSTGAARREVLAVENYPLEKIRMDGETVALLGEEGGEALDPFADDFTRGLATRVVDALNRAPHDRATFFDRQRALARFDPELAAALLARTSDESVRARLALAEALLAAERTFLSAQSESIYQGTWTGEYGDRMRHMISAEYRMLEEQRRLSLKQNVTTALVVLAVAGSLYAANEFATTATSFGTSQTLSIGLMLSSLWGMSSIVDTKAKRATRGENYLAQIAPALGRQVAVQVEWLQSKEEITASDFAEFRAKTLALYQSTARSIAVSVDPNCRFGHPGAEGEGRWLGACDDGRAGGLGYGLLRVAGGGTVEYAGEARGGLADGIGAMIVDMPGQVGAIYYEGAFRAGLPHGIVRVEEPGRGPRVREFREGRDAGAARGEPFEALRF